MTSYSGNSETNILVPGINLFNIYRESQAESNHPKNIFIKIGVPYSSEL